MIDPGGHKVLVYDLLPVEDERTEVLTTVLRRGIQFEVIRSR
jgi:hypothetical protein